MPVRMRGKAAAKPVEVQAPQSRLTLRPLRPDDRQAIIEVLRASRAELDRFAALHREGESDESVFERQLFLTQEGERTGKAWRRIGVLGNGRIAGAFNLNSISRGLELQADVNMWVASPLAGCGLATEGLRQLVAHATRGLPQGLGLHLIEAGVQRGNVASVRVLERVGFVRQGEERTQLRTGTGWKLHDLYAYRVPVSV